MRVAHDNGVEAVITSAYDTLFTTCSGRSGVGIVLAGFTVTTSAGACSSILPKRRLRAAKASSAATKSSWSKSGQSVGRRIVFGVGRLPDEIVAQAHLAAGADDEVGIGQVARVEMPADQHPR